MTSAETVTLSPQPEHEAAGLTPEDLREIYYYMQLTRALEERVRALYLQSKLLGAVYSSRGQEGTAVGSAYALSPEDVVAPLIRDLGASMVRGIPPKHIFAQWLGKVTGPTGGRDGNLHFGDMSRGVLPPISMLGSSIPLCAGIGLAAKQRGEDRVALAYIGDGGTNTGEFHEGLNFAAALTLPLVLIVEDNGYAYSTPVRAHTRVESFAQRAAAYGIPSCTVDGNDSIAVYAATRAAIDRARSGQGPTLVEAKTFRMRGHAEHDDAFYVPSELFAEWAERDPIQRLATYMRTHDLLADDERAEIDSSIIAEIAEAVAWAEDSGMPDGSSQTEGVYAG